MVGGFGYMTELLNTKAAHGFSGSPGPSLYPERSSHIAVFVQFMLCVFYFMHLYTIVYGYFEGKKRVLSFSETGTWNTLQVYPTTIAQQYHQAVPRAELVLNHGPRGLAPGQKHAAPL